MLSRAFYLCIILFLSSTTYGGIYFDRVESPPLDLEASNEPLITHTLQVWFEPKCTTGCSGVQAYRLSFSDYSIGDDEPYDGWYPESNLIDDRLRGYMNEQVSYTGQGTNNNKVDFNLGSWGATTRQPPATYVSVTFTFKLKRLELKKLIDQGQRTLDFYVVGEDTQSSHYIDSIPVSIPITQKETVRISGLEDVSLNPDSLDTFFNACLFSTTGNVSLDFDGSSNSGKNHKLSRSGAGPCNNQSDCIRYRLYVKNSDTDWILYKKKGVRPNRLWQADDEYTDCNGGSNFSIRILIRENDLNNISSGVYKDTMTVTVYPR